VADAPAPTLRTWLREAPFALALSSGFFGFFAHAGVVTVLEEEGLVPAYLCGASSGALVAGMWAAGMPTAAIRAELASLRREHFWDPCPGLGLLRGALLRHKLEALLPVADFTSCHIPLGVQVFQWRGRRTTFIDSGPLAPALHASCAVPVLFQPVALDGGLYSDGGIVDRHGMSSLDVIGREGRAPARVLYHHLASRSPWRLASHPGLRVPRRPRMAALVIEGLPRVGPFRLERGPPGLARAVEATRAALDAPPVLST
jgi:NTE family protein